MAKAKTVKPCAISGCPALRAKNSYVCAAHKQIRSLSVVKKHKYSAIATMCDGIRFASRAEATHYANLKLRLKAGEIAMLRMQTRWPLLVGDTEIGHYVSDFDYWQRNPTTGDSEKVVTDVKGMRTPLYQWKKRHFEAQYGIPVTEVDK